MAYRCMLLFAAGLALSFTAEANDNSIDLFVLATFGSGRSINGRHGRTFGAGSGV